MSGDNCVIKDNYIHNVDGAVYISGGDAKNFTAANHVVKNNNIKNFSRVSKISIPAIQLGGVGNSVIHNEIHDSEYSAIMFGGVNNTIQYNNIYNVCTETADAGAIYAGRSWVNRDIKILNNYFHNMGNSVQTVGTGKNPVAGIFLDDHFAGTVISNNIFDGISGHGVRTNKGRENEISNNIFNNCSLGGFSVGVVNDTEENLKSYYTSSGHIGGIQTILNTSKGYDITKWTEEYPELFNAAKTDYNTDLFYTQNVVLRNNYITGGGSGSGYQIGGNDSTLMGIFSNGTGNVDEDNHWASASAVLADFSEATQTNTVKKVFTDKDLSDFNIIDFSAIAPNPAE